MIPFAVIVLNVFTNGHLVVLELDDLLLALTTSTASAFSVSAVALNESESGMP